jgi:branched-subunit amino acid transport protein
VTAYVVFVVAGIGTYLARSSFILAIGERKLPDSVELALRNIGPAVLAALAASLLTADGLVEYVASIPEVVATLVAIAVSWFTKRYVVSFVAAMAVLWTLQWLL